MNIQKGFTQGADKAFAQAIIHAQMTAAAMHHATVRTGHLLLGLIKSHAQIASAVLGGISPAQIEQAVLLSYGGAQEGFTRITAMGSHIQRVLLKALSYANMKEKRLAAIEHIWLELIHEDGCCAMNILASLGKEKDTLLSALFACVGYIERSEAAAQIPSSANPLNGEEIGILRRAAEQASQDPKADELESYARSLTLAAERGELEPMIGRDQEIDSLIRVLGKKTKNNPLLIGEPGVGKSALVEGLAARIASGHVPPMLKDTKVYALDVALLVAGSRLRGEFEERMKKVIASVQKMGNVILFVDEIHTIVGAGNTGEGSLDAANILKPALARGEIRVIGATTYREYRKYFEKDAALARRFQRIDLQEPGVDETIRILKGLRSRYEEHHGVRITDEAITSAAELSARYVTDRRMPDKAIDLMDEAASMVRLSCWQEADRGSVLDITASDCAKVVSQWTGVPLERLGRRAAHDVHHLEERLLSRIAGQDEAVKTVARSIRRSRAGLNDPSRPIGVFMLLGPSGVGKTELCRALSEALFGSEDALIRIDMSEYAQEASSSRLIGSPPGYVGYGEGGQLTDAVMKRPYSVVLFDEIEKAHPRIFSLLLQLLDDGHLTDSVGHKVNFRNTIIMMTSNAGVSFDMDRRLGFAPAQAGNQEKTILSKVRETFRPEFLGRIDEMIVLNPLSQDAGQRIAALMLDRLALQMQAMGVCFTYEENAAVLLAQKGIDNISGARNLRHTICRMVEDPVSDLLLEQDLVGGSIHVYAADGEICFDAQTFMRQLETAEVHMH